MWKTVLRNAGQHTRLYLDLSKFIPSQRGPADKRMWIEKQLVIFLSYVNYHLLQRVISVKDLWFLPLKKALISSWSIHVITFGCYSFAVLWESCVFCQMARVWVLKWKEECYCWERWGSGCVQVCVYEVRERVLGYRKRRFCGSFRHFSIGVSKQRKLVQQVRKLRENATSIHTSA